MTAIREGKEFIFKICEPRRLGREEDAAGLKSSLMAAQACFLVVLRVSTDDAEPSLLPQYLDQSHAAARVLDDACGGACACVAHAGKSKAAVSMGKGNLLNTIPPLMVAS